MKYATGGISGRLSMSSTKNPASGTVYIPTNLSFTPSYIFVAIHGHLVKSSTSSSWTGASVHDFLISNVVPNTTIGRTTSSSGGSLSFSITNISAAGFTIQYAPTNSVTSYHDINTNHYQSCWYAFGY